MSKVVPLTSSKNETDASLVRFQIGDVVRLKGASPLMTVRRVSKTTVVCDNFLEDHEWQSIDYPHAMLRHANPTELIMLSNIEAGEGDA